MYGVKESEQFHRERFLNRQKKPTKKQLAAVRRSREMIKNLCRATGHMTEPKDMWSTAGRLVWVINSSDWRVRYLCTRCNEYV